MLAYTNLSPRTNSLNYSPSKQSYTFCKNPRFHQLSDKNYPKDYYNLPNYQSKQTASFGLGEKTNFAHHCTDVPGPASYRIASIFEKQNGPTFRYGRNVKNNLIKPPLYYQELQQSGIYQKSDNPSPLNYRIPTTFNRIGFSFGSKPNEQISDSPGPGSYNITSALSPKGSYFVSKFSSSGATIFNPPRSDRFANSSPKNPGPCSYKPKTDLQLGGKYIISNQPSALSYSLSKQPRDYYPKQTIEETPGPGSYKLYSEFGGKI